MVTPDYKGTVEVELKLHVGQNGLVDQAEIVRATNQGVGERLVTTARNWIFAPYIKDGVVHPVVTTVKLRVQATKSR